MENINLSNDIIYPVANLILIDPMLKAQSTSTGLVLANEQDSDSVPMVGKVLKVGEKVATVKEGDTLLFRRYSCDHIIHKDETGEKDFWLLEEESILGIIKINL